MNAADISQIPYGRELLQTRSATPEAVFHSMHFPDDPSAQLPVLQLPVYESLLMHLVDIFPRIKSASALTIYCASGYHITGGGRIPYSSERHQEMRAVAAEGIGKMHADKLIARVDQTLSSRVTPNIPYATGIYIPTLTGFHAAAEIARRRLARNREYPTRQQSIRVLEKSLFVLLTMPTK